MNLSKTHIIIVIAAVIFLFGCIFFGASVTTTVWFLSTKSEITVSQNRKSVEATVVSYQLQPSVTLVATSTPSPTPIPLPTLTPTFSPTPSPVPPTSTPTDIPTNTPTPSPDSPKTDGFYRVGVDIVAGKWKSTGTGDGCYWARYDNNQKVMGNHFGNAGGVLKIQETDFEVEFQDCGTWEYIENREIVLQPDATNSKEDGFYIVGVDIAPGRWRSTGTGDNCYWALQDENQEILDNHLGLAGGTVTIENTDFEVLFEDCGIWEYEGEIVVQDTIQPEAPKEVVSSQPSSLKGATSIPPGKWEYFASDVMGGQSEFIAITIKPEDAQNGVITFISANYGNNLNPCTASFGNIPVELEESEIKFHQFTNFGSVVGSVIADEDKISVLIDDYLCTGDLFGVLTRIE